MNTFNTYQDVSNYLDQLPLFQDKGLQAARFGLEGITRLCEAIGNPQRHLRMIHVAGTNGKGSVCHLLHAVYWENGYRTGVYTSPHLHRFNERFVVDNQPISDQELLQFFQQHGQAVLSCFPTYFELSTAIAFWYFSCRKVEVAIIETGLGGRLDATNIIEPMVSVITSIGLDHTDILGATLAEIAAEKAGIIKPGTPVVIGKLPVEAKQTIVDAARSRESAVADSTDYYPQWENGKVIIRDQGVSMEYETFFHQPVQKFNVAMVLSVISVLKTQLPVNASPTRQAIRSCSRNGVYKARFEKISAHKDWYFDGAHNTEAFSHALTLTHQLAGKRKKILVFSIMRDKLTKDLLLLFSQFDEIYYVESSLNRAARYQEVCGLIPNVKGLSDHEWGSFQTKHLSDSAFILFSGSLYFYSRIMNLLGNTT